MRIEDEDKDQIALASEILGERQLRKELSAMNPAYKNKNKPVLQVISVAASIALIVGIYFGFFNRGNEEIQEMIEEGDRYGDGEISEEGLYTTLLHKSFYSCIFPSKRAILFVSGVGIFIGF